jgi:ATP phosphoribosyltransferase
MLTFVLPTGRTLDEAVELLKVAGFPVRRLEERGRDLVIEEEGFRYLLAKPADVPTLVFRGAAELALVGSDVLWESGADLMELLDTGRGRCRIVVAGPRETAARFSAEEAARMGIRVATKYPRIATSAFEERGISAEIVKLSGSIELAPRLGLADCILDIVQTGSTLEANGLVPFEEIAPVSLRLAASRTAFRTRGERVEAALSALSRACRTGGGSAEESEVPS